MTTVYAIRALLWALLIALWTPTLVIASQVTLTETLSSIGMATYLFLAVLSTLSGLTALVMRIDTELRASGEKRLPRPVLFVFSHMLGSWLAGMLVFAACEGSGAVNDWTEIVVIIIGSFYGARTIEKYGEKYLPKGTVT